MTQRLSTASSQIRNLRPVSRKVFVVPTRDRRSFADRTFSGTAQLSLLDQAPMLLSTGQSGVLLGGDRHSANTWERNLRLRGLHRTPPWYPRSRNGAEAPTSRQATASSRAPRNRQPTLHQSAMHSISTLQATPHTGLLSDSEGTLYGDGALTHWVTPYGPRHGPGGGPLGTRTIFGNPTLLPHFITYNPRLDNP